MIYFIQSGKKGPIKIGYSKNNIEARLNYLQTGSHEQLYLLGRIEGEIEDEKELHKKYDKYRIRGEWFEPTASLTGYIFTHILTSGFHDDENEYDIEPIGFSLDSLLSNIEYKYIRKALSMTSGHKQKAAELLGLSFRTFRYRVQKHDI